MSRELTKQIIPAVLGETYTEIERQLKILDGHTDWMHLDITDGHFTPIASWPLNSSGSGALENLKFLDGKTKIEVHLMVEAPETMLSDWLEVADRIIIHYEATDQLVEIIDSFSSSRIKLGLALLLPTPIEKLAPYLPKINFIQLMSIAEIGRQGHPFDARVLEKIKHLRHLSPDVIIQIDGGVNLETAKVAIEAGADNLVVGSTIWQSPDPVVALKSFQSLLEANP